MAAEPVNLVMELLRQMRAEAVQMRAESAQMRVEAAAFRKEMNDRFDALSSRMESEFKAVRGEISVIRRQTIGEVYKANKTFAGFADLEARMEAVEHKVFGVHMA